ncbi:hypothetical protein [Lentzea sp. NBRC 105346]|uniref:hypothetical protein n=1 Tax=Lentzea sp. NBRC 105346 TaxID=3032205 RepID=UPI002555EAC1|nr:hypothetical protein [Lentzea sp. NBRC 105346]
MIQQHETPPAILRMWWRLPTWSRVLPVLGGSLLAPIAFMSMSAPQPPAHHAAEALAPVTPRPVPSTKAAPPVVVEAPAANPRGTAAGAVTKVVTAAPPPVQQPTTVVVTEQQQPAPSTTTQVGAPCTYQGEIAAYADSAPTVCALTGNGDLRWRKM